MAHKRRTPPANSGAKPGKQASSAPFWRIRFAEDVLTEDVDSVGYAALQVARATIDKKLKADPDQYGEPLRSPLGGLHKLKASHLRIVHHIEHVAREVWILMIGNRSTIWKDEEIAILERLGVAKGRIARERTESGRDQKSRAVRGEAREPRKPKK